MLSKDQLYVVGLAQRLLADPRLDIQNVKEKVSAATETPLRKLLAKSEKKKRTPYLRSLIYFLYDQLGLDYGWIKRMTGRSDHTTIRFGIEQMYAFIVEYNRTAAQPIRLPEKRPPYLYSVTLIDRLLNEQGVTPENIELRLSNASGVSLGELHDSSKESPVVTVRQVRDYVLSERFGKKLCEIVKENGRDYKSVKQGVEKMRGYVMRARERQAR